ncbi:uncharacterized protein LOC118511790 [Anopheles stephensi]|uniref:uncharacterized protein LOC118511790 n=1 Tax=Anopheles stephensi TaxID=30069 RepID=UPI00165875DC|nr:uncharacterized protein LOC118511790 [Anopheles stephensi]XP_035911211.1 uncharacterized protein LOC118511790 [Anopheles stephensi]
MEHDVVRRYSDNRVKISGWAEKIQQYPYDCPWSTVGRAAYRTFGYTTKHFIPRTSTQAMSDTVWGHFQQRQLAQKRAKKPHCSEVKVCPYITSYQHDYFDRFPAFRKLMMINALHSGPGKQ